MKTIKMRKHKMKKIYTRKIILLSAIFVLLVIYILQVSFSKKTNTKTILFDEEISSVEISKNGNILVALNKVDDKWQTEKSLVMENRANGIINSIKEIKVLEIVAQNSDNLELYGLEKENALIVKANTKEKPITLTIGKKSTVGSQCYIQINDDKKIYLVQGDLRTTFEITPDEIKEKEQNTEQNITE